MNGITLALITPVCICLICAITVIPIIHAALSGTQPQDRAAILRAIAMLIRAIQGRP